MKYILVVSLLMYLPVDKLYEVRSLMRSIQPYVGHTGEKPYVIHIVATLYDIHTCEKPKKNL